MAEYWYPTQSRVDALNKELTHLEEIAATQARGASAYVPSISGELANAQHRPGFPNYQIPRWMWLASQFRLHSGAPNGIAAKAGAALLFLSGRIAADHVSESDVQDLNWVLESTVCALSQAVDPEDLRSCLSAEELSRVDERLGRYAEFLEFDGPAIRAAVARQMGVLRAFGKVGDLSSLEDKVDALFDAAVKTSPDAKPARAALRYLADEDDVVGDRSGILGLMDDIYAVEWAYAAVEKRTRCLPLLDALLRNWPFVGDLALTERGNAPLDRYGQYVACAALYSLFGPTTSGLLILREPGAYGIIAAVMAAVECARRQGEPIDQEVALWRDGEPVTVSDGAQTFRVTFKGRMQIGRRMRYRLGVKDRGVITVDEAILPYIARSTTVHKRLSSGNSILIWLKNRHVDPLVYLTGTGRRRLEEQDCVLLVGPKHKLDEYLSCLRPLGSTPQALLGVRYVNTQQQIIDLSGSATDRPLIHACTDVSTAFDLISDPPEHVKHWKVIVDGARLGRAMHAALSTAGDLQATPVCVFAELSEREASADLISQGLERVWYLEDQDVEIPPVAHRRPPDDADAVSRFLARQSNHWAATQTFYDIQDDFLESVVSCLSDRTKAERQDSESRLLDLTVSTFVQKAIAQPVGSWENMGSLGGSIAGQASTLRQYDPIADRLFALFRGFLDGGSLLRDRTEHLMRIVREAGRGESLAVVCRSVQIAERCRAASLENALLSRFDWLSLEGLRRQAPYDRVVVPGWIDRLAMRELANNGYGASMDLVLLPFERRWFDSTTTAMRRWERRLEQNTVERLKGLAAQVVATNRTPQRWRDQTDLRLAEPVANGESDGGGWDNDEPEIEWLEARSVEALSHSASQGRPGQPTAKAQLVLFEEPGVYAFLAPTGKAIVLSSADIAASEGAVAGNAERLLFRNVAHLEPGMLLALSLGQDRDLVDARADQFLSDASEVRSCASLWKAALRRHLSGGNEGALDFSRRMATAGEPRDPATIRAWISQTQTVAPRNYRHVVPLLARLTGDAELKRRCDEVLQSIDLIYRARALAAEAIVRELFAGEIDLEAPELRFRLSGREISYALHRVRRLAGFKEVPIEFIGKVGHFAASRLADPDDA